MNRHVNAIAGRLSLRPLQLNSLEILDWVTEVVAPRKEVDGGRALAALRGSRGSTVALSDAEILEAQALTGRLAGIFAEPAVATSVAVAKKLRAAGRIGPDDVVVCNLTGHGLKQPEAIRLSEKEFAPIVPTLEALRDRVKGTAEQFTP